MNELLWWWFVTPPALFGGLATLAVVLGLYPPTPRDLGGAADLDAAAERVRIPVGEGDTVDGWFLRGQSETAVLLLHGYGRTHHRMWRYAGFLHPRHSVLAIDFRSSRRRRRLPTTLGKYEIEDALAAADWLKAHPGVARVTAFGESLGGSAGLILAARDPRVEAVIVDCPFSAGREAMEDMLRRFLRLPRWPTALVARSLCIQATGHDPYGVDVVAAAEQLRDRPVFFIHSVEDERLAPAHTERLWAAAGAKDPVWWVQAAGHNQAWLRHRTEYERRVAAFLATDTV